MGYVVSVTTTQCYCRSITETIQKQMGVAVFQSNFIYRNRRPAGVGPPLGKYIHITTQKMRLRWVK